MIHKVEEKITCNEFCRRKTLAHQLCVIRDCGWIVETVWIDHEDLFRISEKSRNAEVVGWEFGKLPVVSEVGQTVQIPCLYIDIK